MAENKVLVRLKPLDPQGGIHQRRFCVFGLRFDVERGWYEVTPSVAKYLATKKSGKSPHAPKMFDVAETVAQAKEIEMRHRQEMAMREVTQGQSTPALMPQDMGIDVSAVGTSRPVGDLTRGVPVNLQDAMSDHEQRMTKSGATQDNASFFSEEPSGGAGADFAPADAGDLFDGAEAPVAESHDEEVAPVAAAPVVSAPKKRGRPRKVQ